MHRSKEINFCKDLKHKHFQLDSTSYKLVPLNIQSTFLANAFHLNLGHKTYFTHKQYNPVLDTKDGKNEKSSKICKH